ncbi:caspase family protein [Microvirga terrae]|uniref:Caspase family protein n=1 Tax=Microvirga terrae TaxID=2740529 RepID=A0ABY5RLU0_9HYPH|nr:caspase family protein [Microvirga terrae]UVF18191.1 caspase family protein [Microvirga terrae]
MSRLKRAIVIVGLTLAALGGPASAAFAQDRLALVIGQGAYTGRSLATAINDAGLVAQTLTSAGFEVIQGRDLGANDLRSLVRDFLDKAQDLEPGSTVVVYLAGHGVQLEGENYLVPVDARIERDVDVPIEGFRLSDLVRSLERSPAQARIVVADMARDYPLAAAGEPIARGLALMEPPAGFLMAYSSAPNITAVDGQGPYGPYATALAEMIRQPGMPLDEVFARTRLRTHEATNGVQIPWHSANLGQASFVFFEQAEAAAPPLVREVRRIEEVPAEEAYAIAVERDTIQDYQAFLRRYPDHRLARRVTALLAARREALVWRRTLASNTREAYWTYLRRYPNGPHAPDSRRRLARLSAPYAPPAAFEEVVYDDLPPPLPEVERVEVVEVVTIIRDVPPPRVPVYLLPPPDEDEDFVTIIREPPPPPVMAGILPIPMAIPVPVRARPPRSFYQPIAPVTPRGPVAIPVAAPPVLGALMGAEGGPRPRRGLRPEQPVVPRQPGLAAPIQPIPASVDRRGPREDRGARPGEAPRAGPVRLPTRPIPLADVPRERLRPERFDAGEPPRPDGPRGLRPAARDPEPRRLRPEAPVRDAARPGDPRTDRGEILPRQPRPERPRPDSERERPGWGDLDRPAPRIRPEQGAPAAVRPADGLPPPEERHYRGTDRPRQPVERERPATMERPDRERPSRRIAPQFERPDAPTVQPRPVPRMEVPREERAFREMQRPPAQPRPGRGDDQPARIRPTPGPSGGRPSGNGSEWCRPGYPCAERLR